MEKMYVKTRIHDLIRIKSKESRKAFLRLDMNENPDGMPEEFFRKAVEQVTAEDAAMYPELFALHEQIAAIHKVRKENVLILNGTDEGLKSIFEVFGAEGKEFVSVYPTFEMYKVYAQMYGMKCRFIGYTQELTVSVSEIVEAISDETAIVSILNPNNPIGNAFTEKEAVQILDKAKEKGAIVVIDEAYYHYYGNSFVELAKKYENAILLRTFSKLCAMAGCRIGYLIASSEIVELVDKVRPSAGVNVFAVQIASALWKHPEVIEELKSREREGRQYLLEELKKMNYEIFPGNGNYILFKPNHSSREIYDALKERGILVKIYSFPVLKDYVRVTTAGKDNMKKFILALKEADGIKGRIYGREQIIDPEEVKQLYAKRADKSDRVHVDAPVVLSSDVDIKNIELWTDWELKKWFPMLGLNKESVVFELGFGSGRMTKYILPVVKRYVGVDYVKEFVDIIQKRGDIDGKEKALFFNEDFEEFLEKVHIRELPRFTHFFLSGGVFMYMNDRVVRKCIEKMENMLDEKSIIYISEPVALIERLTLHSFYSKQIDDKYSAIYRTEDEYKDLFSPLLEKGYVWKTSELFFEEDIKKQKETQQWMFILER